MHIESPQGLTNWHGQIDIAPKVVAYPSNPDDLREILSDPQRFPSPVRPVGSRHSVTRCLVTGSEAGRAGTLIRFDAWPKTYSLDRDAEVVTVSSNTLYIDLAQQLAKDGYQLHVNCEIGNLTLGSAATAATKDSSFPGGYGQVGSYVVAIHMIAGTGEQLTITPDDGNLMKLTRSSYGLFGVVYLVSIRVKKRCGLSVHNANLSLEELERRWETLEAQSAEYAQLMFLYPFLNKVTFEQRKEDVGVNPRGDASIKIRNRLWVENWAARIGNLTNGMPDSMRHWSLNSWLWLLATLYGNTSEAHNLSPEDQLVRFDDYGNDPGGFTFSMWAFPVETFPGVLRQYFEFCQNHRRDHGYRCNMPNIGYRIARDDNAWLSYSRESDVWTLDPVTTGRREKGWESFLDAFNDFAVAQPGACCLFNQTPRLQRRHAQAAYGPRFAALEHQRRILDPDSRLLNSYFKELFTPD